MLRSIRVLKAAARIYLRVVSLHALWDPSRGLRRYSSHNEFSIIRTAMTTFETADTEEKATCLYLTVYHPSQQEKKVFRELNFHQRYQLKAGDLVRFGRDCNVCDFNLVDARVSRVQFALQFFRYFDSEEFGFEIKNLSDKIKLTVDDVELGYLNKVDLPENCTVCFGDYEIFMHKQGGLSKKCFEIQFELAKASLLQGKNLSFQKPVPEQGLAYTDCPIEMDENEWGRSQR